MHYENMNLHFPYKNTLKLCQNGFSLVKFEFSS